MKILVAPDSFKDFATAAEVGMAIKEALLGHDDQLAIKVIPLSDGGEGFVMSLKDRLDLDEITLVVHDPLGREIEASYLLGDQKAIMEMASASGLQLLSNAERNPRFTSTYGTGEMIKDAFNRGAKEVYLGIGGSATNDLGFGMASALGCVFYDQHQQIVSPRGDNLSTIAWFKDDALLPFRENCKLWVACDVDNPLVGKNGAAYTYGPQKGAMESALALLDQELAWGAKLLYHYYHKEVSHIPGAGAAGGLGAGCLAFLKGTLIEGAEFVFTAAGMEEAVKWADCIITGEGRFDHQSFQGKVIGRLIQLTKEEGKPLLIVAGSIEDAIDLPDHVYTYPLTQHHEPKEVGLRQGWKRLDQVMDKIYQEILPKFSKEKSTL